MELLVAFATDDGNTFNDDHFGMAQLFHIYKFSKGKEEFIEARKNARYEEDESLKHGDPAKAKAVSSVLKDIDVIVGKKMGPNIIRLLNKYVCIVIKTTAINDAIAHIHKHMKKVMEEKGKGQDRRHIVLKP